MKSSVSLSAGPIHLGLDVSKDKFAVGILRWGEQVPDVETIINDEASVRRLIDRFDRGQLRVCYEAGPTGFGLHRLLTSMGVACEVIAPALIPKRIKKVSGPFLHRLRLRRIGSRPIGVTADGWPDCTGPGSWSRSGSRPGGGGGARSVPGPADLVQDRTRTRHRLSKFLLRHDRIWRQDAWTGKHEQWLLGQRFDNPGLRVTYAHYRAVLAARDAELAALEADLAHWYTHGPFADAVRRLAATAASPGWAR